MSAKFTPGPWRAESSQWPRIQCKGQWWQVWATGQGDSDFIADVGRTDNATDEDVERDAATARLIAASPDFYALTARMLEMMEHDHAHELATNHEGDGPDGCTYCEWMAEARAQIAKVNGDSQ